MPRRSFSVHPFTQLAPLAACTRKLLWQHAIPTAMTRYTEQSDNAIVTFDKSLLSFRHWADGNFPSSLCNKFATDLTTKLWISPFSAFRRTKIVVNRIQFVELSLYRSRERMLPAVKVPQKFHGTLALENVRSWERKFLGAKRPGIGLPCLSTTHPLNALSQTSDCHSPQIRLLLTIVRVYKLYLLTYTHRRVMSAVMLA